MTGREKVLCIEGQIRAMIAGEQDEFFCPFCMTSTKEENQILCCNEAADVINAVLDHVEYFDTRELIDKIMERVQSMPSVYLN